MAPSIYFEGTVYNYNAETGEITIYQIQNINGSFSDPATYNVILLPGSQELVKLRTRVNELYQILFQLDLTSAENSNYDLVISTQSNYVNMLYYYFFDRDIPEDTDYRLTNAYLNAKIQDLYAYFFDLDITTNKNRLFNPNNNGILLNTLQNRISQMYLYLFNNNLGVTLLFAPVTM